ncbi:MAG: tetratricopeptide repeat protein [Elusimicrobia bacterium]|nr:tetratricopeptide repeat protein [Elusimicrobiota bacterium]
MKLLLATRNNHKKREICDLLKGLPVEVATLDSFPGIPEVDEDQPTLEGNAEKKAVSCANGSGLWALADDTGLEVEALGGAPGVYSARFAALDGVSLEELNASARKGPVKSCTFEEDNAKLLEALSHHHEQCRGAVFRTVMALSDPEGKVILEEGCLEGSIAKEPKGTHGFGYDPVFLVSKNGKTLAEMKLIEKNAISHRSEALKRMVPHIKKLAFTLACALLFLPPAFAGRTEPGQETIWDQIMASQAHRGLRLGSRYLDEKNYDLALKEFSRAVAANPKDATAHMMLGVAYYWTGQVDLSLEEYRASLALEPNNAQDWMLIGISLAWKGDVKGSYEAFKKSAEIDPNRADIQMNLGSIEDSLNLVPDALEHFRKAVNLAPREALYHFQLGSFYRKLGRDQEAGEELREALKFYAEFEDALLELGAVDERTGDRRAAVHDFKRAVDLKSRDSVARLRLGRLYLLTNEPKKAREVFVESFHLTPEEGGAGLQLSISYAGGKTQGGGRPPSGAADGNSQQAHRPEPPLDAGDPMNVFRRNLERIPLEQSAVMQVDVVFAPKPKLIKASPESASSLKQALQQRMNEAGSGPKAVRREYQLRAASPQERADQIARIIADLRKTMKDAPADSDVRLGMNLNFTRLASAATGRADGGADAKVSYEPRQVGNDMGLWVIGTGWMAMVEEVLPEPGDKPGHPEASDWWLATGLAYAVVGDGQRALTAFQRAVHLDANNEAAYLGQGVAQVMTGDETAAAESYREALKLNPKNRPAAEGLKWLLRPSTKAKPPAEKGGP